MQLDDEYLTTEEVASVVRKTPATMCYLRSIGKGPKAGRLGKRVIYRKSDVQKWVDSAFEEVSK